MTSCKQHPVRNLGVMYDKNMSMKSQVSSIVKTTSYHTRNISRIRKYIDTDSAKTLVNSLVTSRLDYCNSQLAGINSGQFDRLDRVQNCAARVILQLPRSVAPDLSSLHWLPIRQRVDYKIATLVFKTLHGLAPSYLQELLTPYTAGRHLRSDNDNLLVVPRTTNKSGNRSFVVNGPCVWNALPCHVRCTSDLNVFKRLLKTVLFRRAFNC